MPTIAADQQKLFKLTINSGLPEAAIDVIGDVQWLKCCPLCGCTHQIFNVNEKKPYTPLCQTMPVLYKPQQILWQQSYPDVAQYKTVSLVWKSGEEPTARKKR